MTFDRQICGRNYELMHTYACTNSESKLLNTSCTNYMHCGNICHRQAHTSASHERTSFKVHASQNLPGRMESNLARLKHKTAPIRIHGRASRGDIHTTLGFWNVHRDFDFCFVRGLKQTFRPRRFLSLSCLRRSLRQMPHGLPEIKKNWRKNSHDSTPFLRPHLCKFRVQSAIQAWFIFIGPDWRATIYRFLVSNARSQLSA